MGVMVEPHPGKTAAEVRAELTWEPTGIPRRFWGRGLADVGHRSSTVVALLEQWVAGFPSRHAMGDDGLPRCWDGLGLGLHFYGPPGTGKTTMACALLTSFRRVNLQSIYFTRWDAYVNAQKLLHDVADDKLSFRSRAVTDATLVVLDDVGHEYLSSSGYAERLLDYVTRTRFDAGKPTAITTNLSKDEWTKRYDETLTSFIQRACEPVFFGDVE